MSTLKDIFPNGFTLPAPPPLLDKDKQLRIAMSDAGITPPDVIVFDGKLHRFGTKKTSWYVAHDGKIPAGAFGDWKQGSSQNWGADIGRELTHMERMQHEAHRRKIREDSEKEIAEIRENAALKAADIWESTALASNDHPYIERKGITNPGWHIAPDGRLISPLYVNGELVSLQYINADGEKRFMTGGQAGGGWWHFGGSILEAKRIYVAEGVATAASIFEATGKPVAVAYSANNIEATCSALRELSATAEIVIVADNDAHGVGASKAKAAADHVPGVNVMVCEGHKDANDMAQAGVDLSAWLEPANNEEWLIQADAFCAQPAPIKWLINGWLQDSSLIMIHGPSGGGKTFVVLDWCLRVASSTPEWIGHKVKPGAVVYLAGEGHHGLRGRVAAWKHHHNATGLNMWLSKGGCDLNTPAGYIKAAAHIRSLPVNPCIIAMDTLHRFLDGDENSAQDTKTMLDACAALIKEFNCSVILVHHTGVSDEAQHRARGSSAWRGALDIEISVIPAKGDAPMEIVQRKSKDAELAQTVFVELSSVEIPNWFDEDNNPVTSAVVIESTAPIRPEQKDNKTQEAIKLMDRAWFASGAEDRGGAPYISRSALRELLISDGMNERTAKNKTEPSREDGYIFRLINSEIIRPYEHGWIFTNEVQISSMMMRRGGN